MPVSRFSRRSLLTTHLPALTAPAFIPNLISAPPSDTVRLASFGAGNMAFVTLRMLAVHPKVKTIAIAEVDRTKLGEIATGEWKAKFERATIYPDWRRMLDKEHKHLDAVCIGLPDHMHAPAAMTSMHHGLAVYGQKPLAHDIYEVRRLTEMARERKLVTQMGIQIHSRLEYKTAVSLVQTGAIGKIREVHSWSEKEWGDMEPMPDRSDPVPATLDWDLWLGVCAPRPFLDNKYYTPLNWRKRMDFGTATFGDMGCHILDPVFGALQLTAPVSVRSEGPAPTAHNWAVNTVIRYVFPATPYTEGKTVPVSWYDGDERPPAGIQALVGPKKIPGQGSIFVGSEGAMLLPHVGKPELFPENKFRDFKIPGAESDNHYNQFVDAVTGTGKTSASFDYAGPLTESVLLGPIATRFPQTTLEWDAAKLRFRGAPEASQYVRKQYRKGWRVKGL